MSMSHPENPGQTACETGQQTAVSNGTIVTLTAAVAVAIGLSFGAVTQDDAFISFRYAENLVAGHGLVFNPGEWVEGYTNLLWTLLIAGVLALGGDPVIATTIMGLLCLMGVVVATWRLGNEDWLGRAAIIGGPILIAADAQLILESVEGLETALFALLVTLGTRSALIGQRRGGGLWFVLACLTRPEGVLIWGMLQSGLLVRAWRSKQLATQAARALKQSIPIILCLIALTVWRLHTYGDPLPNTFYAKTGGLAIPRGLTYLWTHISSHPVLWSLATTGAWLSRAQKRTIPLVVTVVLYLSYVVVVGGDFKPTGRFIIPVLPLLAVLAQGAIAAITASKYRAALLILLGISIAWTGVSRLEDAQGHAQERHANLVARKLVGDWIAANTPADTVIAIHSAGVIPYYSNRRTIDMWGLTNRTIARTEVTTMGSGMAGHEKTNPAYVFSLKPDLYLPEHRVFTLKAWDLEIASSFPEEFVDHYQSRSIQIDGRFLNLWVRTSKPNEP